MNNWRIPTMSLALALGCLAVTVVWAQAKPPVIEKKQGWQPQMQQQQQTALTGQCTTPDKVAVTDLTLNPSEPKQGEKVVVTLTIRNLCKVPLANVV